MESTATSEPAAITQPQRGLWRRAFALLDEREPGTSLALFRIGCGLTVLWSIGGAVVWSVAPVVWLDRADGGYRTLDAAPWLFQMLGGVNPATLWSMIAVSLIAGVLLTIGFGGRITALVALQSYLAIANINAHATGGDDALLGNALWLLVLAQSTATLSLDCRLRTGRWTDDRPVPAWPRYLAVYQLVLVYFMTGVQKMSILWTPAGDFAALYYMLQEPSWQRWDMSWLAWLYPLTQVGTVTVRIWELAAPALLLALWYRRTRERPGLLRATFNRVNFRRWYVLFGVAMHLGVFILIGLGPFTWATLSFYFCLYHPGEWKPAGERSSTAAPSRFPRWQRYLVRGFVTFHLVAVTLMAIPTPGHPNRDDWDRPVVQDEFAAWTARLNGWGIAVTQPQFESWLWKAARTNAHVRDAVLGPLSPYYEYCGAYQGWSMFVGANLYPTRLHIEIKRGEALWTPVFIESRGGYTWRRGQFAHEHLRGALYSMAFLESHKTHFHEFAQWAAGQAAQDFPQATRVRIRMHRYHTPTPRQVRQGRPVEGEFVKSMSWEFETASQR